MEAARVLFFDLIILKGKVSMFQLSLFPKSKFRKKNV